ncbi:MAG: YicC family protein [Planctomycetes bacterium]|nr:YicC family protein [Planctomycetota bacterium]
MAKTDRDGGAITSMTGFGVGAVEENGLAARVEIKSVNNRGLKLSIRSRPSLGIYEKNIRDLVTDRLRRGSIDVYVTYERTGEGQACPLRLEAAREAVAGLRRLAAELGLDDTLSARDLALIPGIFEHSAEEPATAAEWATIERAVAMALDQVVGMRREEGAELERILSDLADPLEEFVRLTNTLAPRALERSRERLRQRLAEICPNGFNAADNQALEREMCLIADKADIREELDRLGSHISQYRAALRQGGEIGKRVEFIAQEFLREINTTASKTNDTEVVQAAVQAKLTVEKIKEQCANLV